MVSFWLEESDHTCQSLSEIVHTRSFKKPKEKRIDKKIMDKRGTQSYQYIVF